MALEGRYYDGQTATCKPIRLELGDGDRLYPTPPLFEPQAMGNVSIASRIGNTPRTITLASGAVIETDDHNVLDAWTARRSRTANLVHRFESRFCYVLAALACVIVIMITGAVWGVPWISNVVAQAVPAEAVARLGSETMNYLDKSLLEPSELKEPRRAELSQRFNTLLPEDAENLNYNLAFRGGGYIGANAFALPDGTVVITDELVELAGNDDEIAAILLHEIGHVVHRHGLRQVISHAGLSALMIVFTGDVTAAGALVVALPSILMQSSYSRDLEWEADSYALQQMRAIEMPLHNFADFLERMEGQLQVHDTGTDDTDLACEPEQQVALEDLGFEEDQTADEKPVVVETDSVDRADPADIEHTPKEPTWSGYLSSHPPSEDRIARFREAAHKNNPHANESQN